MHCATLLVAADFDGTLAPIVDNPDKVQANEESLAALRALAGMADTHVAIASGRSLADLARHVGDVRGMHLIGSHGAESHDGVAAKASPEAMAALSRAREYIRRIAACTPGSLVEDKPTGCAFHYRNVEGSTAAARVEELLSAVRQWPELTVRHGKKVVELSAVRANKGEALQSLGRHLGATCMVYIGDDLTDEDVFRTLGAGDIGIKVGEGPTAARYHLVDTHAVSRMLMSVLRQRTQWIATGGSGGCSRQDRLRRDH